MPELSELVRDWRMARFAFRFSLFGAGVVFARSAMSVTRLPEPAVYVDAAIGSMVTVAFVSFCASWEDSALRKVADHDQPRQESLL